MKCLGILLVVVCLCYTSVKASRATLRGHPFFLGPSVLRRGRPLWAQEGDPESMRKIRLLRTCTGRGTQDCFMALKKANGDVRAASELLLSEHGTDKSGQESTPVVDLFEGRIAIETTKDLATIVDMRCETDFVAKSKMFSSLAKSFANAVHQMMSAAEHNVEDVMGSMEVRRAREDATKRNEDHDGTDAPHSEETENSPFPALRLEELKGKKCLRCSRSLGEAGALVRGVLGEDVVVSRIGFIRPKDSELLFSYVHGPTELEGQLSFVGPSASLLVMDVMAGANAFCEVAEEDVMAENVPSDGIVENIASDDCCCILGKPCVYSRDKRVVIKDDNVKKLCRQLSMHVLGEKPMALTLEEYDPVGIEEVKQSVRETNANKPQEIVDKIIAGRLRKQFGEFVLMEQVRMNA